ncbi:activator of HSP90 ATPase [Flagellimonas alvinocaridis]|uniref:Activator of HSP90 ATPase n=1 Tax=Flagellimonas alvinocaridis TaxID=2530200 RepID=A0A4S8RFZ5_9FLAO|nr:SRPBCC family protein [Allomuricauda alvinocaridis]THV57253.1 activator of HSP90 ATPase [Allomuricauda alvinocaridis]
MDTTPITIDVNITATLDKVWDFYTKPEHITQWNFADDSWHCPSAKNDLRKGGKYIARMEAKDGSFGFDFEAVYDEVIPQKKIAFTLEDGRKTIVLFEESHKETKVTITFDAEKENSLEMQKNGWQAILNNFKKYTESH